MDNWGRILLESGIILLFICFSISVTPVDKLPAAELRGIRP